jgi:hypothetical protein
VSEKSRLVGEEVINRLTDWSVRSTDCAQSAGTAHVFYVIMLAKHGGIVNLNTDWCAKCYCVDLDDYTENQLTRYECKHDQTLDDIPDLSGRAGQIQGSQSAGAEFPGAIVPINISDILHVVLH